MTAVRGQKRAPPQQWSARISITNSNSEPRNSTYKNLRTSWCNEIASVSQRLANGYFANGYFVFFFFFSNSPELGSPRPSTEPKTPKPQKVSKKVSREVSGTPRDTPKSSKESPKSPKIVKINYFLDFSDFFGNILGVPGGPRDLSGDFFGDFLGFGVLGSVDGRGDPNPKRPPLRERKGRKRLDPLEKRATCQFPEKYASHLCTESEKIIGHAKTQTHLKLQNSMPQFNANCCPDAFSEILV